MTKKHHDVGRATAFRWQTLVMLIEGSISLATVRIPRAPKCGMRLSGYRVGGQGCLVNMGAYRGRLEFHSIRVASEAAGQLACALQLPGPMHQIGSAGLNVEPGIVLFSPSSHRAPPGPTMTILSQRESQVPISTLCSWAA